MPTLSYPWQLPGMILTGFGLGLTISPTNTDALSRVTQAERAQGSGLIQTIRQLGGTVGVAVVSAVVLGIESAGTQSPSAERIAGAMAVGFGMAALAFAVALLIGWRLLSTERIEADEPARAVP